MADLLFDFNFRPEDHCLLVQNAFCFAVESHDGQYRNHSNIPYISHPIGVAAILFSAGCSAEEVAAGLNHDVREDCPDVTYAILATRTSLDVADIVESVTFFPDKTLPREVRVQQQKAHLMEGDSRTHNIKCADIIHNFTDFVFAYNNNPNKAMRYLAEKKDQHSILTKADPILFEQCRFRLEQCEIFVEKQLIQENAARNLLQEASPCLG
ncbi:HD domain-containing protein [Neptuniibacter sp. QD37_11]|uniref:HD domain-containing protein n=1 Tax=Neptuniibacter sp. QD37_11 TaxID=3398209 RepID=UPI0039F45759